MNKTKRVLLGGVVLFCSILFTSCAFFPIQSILVSGVTDTGEVITFTFNTSSGQEGSFFWLFGDGGTGSGNPVMHIYITPGTYQVEVKVAVGGKVITFTRTIVIDNAGNKIYWTNRLDDSIGRANLDGTGVNNSFIATGGDPQGVAVDGAFIYWANSSDGTLGRANLDGMGVNNSFIATGADPHGVAVDLTHIYWTNSADDTIGRANLDGTGVDNNFLSTGVFPVHLDIGD